MRASGETCLSGPYSGGTRLSGPFLPEGRACHVRCATFDDQFPLPGHDKRAPPNNFPEGPARQVRFFGGTRLSTFDIPFAFTGD
ncbi:hypothetical protein THTE_4492 [Thermogutta terrifontis]|uniref:Uncharacterized protein n=1 Tax=Thermogutta terrifontis TaxID=1331910 RepID=A0A286RM90_9BACT|nr:hypothetical protein THTE_4492 [Thermogutta terrifontis]